MADWLSLLLRTSRAVFDPFFLKLLLLSALMCAAGFAAFAGLAWLGISWLDLADSWWAGWLFRWVGPGVAVFAGYFLFPVVFPLVTLLFLEPVAAHIERRHYPEATPGTAPSLKAELPNTLRFVALSLLINLMALPWYLIPGVYYIVNGYLFGREYFELIALRQRFVAPDGGFYPSDFRSRAISELPAHSRVSRGYPRRLKPRRKYRKKNHSIANFVRHVFSSRAFACRAVMPKRPMICDCGCGRRSRPNSSGPRAVPSKGGHSIDRPPGFPPGSSG